jgi:large subunit ribosomal protein L7/L12
MALNKEEILEAIAGLTVIELKELLDAFEEKFGVSASAPVAVMAAGGGAAAGHSHRGWSTKDSGHQGSA